MPEYVCSVQVVIDVDLDVTADNYGLAEEIAIKQFNQQTLYDFSNLKPFVTKIEFLI